MLRPASDNFAQPKRAPTTPVATCSVDPGPQENLASLVVDADAVAVGYAAALGIGTTDLQLVLTLHLLKAGQIDERRIQKIVGFTRQQLQRKSFSSLAGDATRLVGQTRPPDPSQ